MYLKQGLEEMKGRLRGVFHVPGHRFGVELAEAFQGSLLNYDFTELRGTDHLHQPTGIIACSQERVRALYGSDATFFLVNGSTGGILAALYSTLSRGDKLLIARESHQAAWHGLELAGAIPILLEQEMDAIHGCYRQLTPEALEAALAVHPEVTAIFLTYPNYFGHGCAIKKMIAIGHKYDKIVIVDSAHGAHLFLDPTLPQCAVAAGADLVIQSTHKTLYGMTQASWMHLSGQRVSRLRLERALRMLQSSSPSYVLMTSLDITGAILETRGEAQMQALLRAVADFQLWATARGIRFLEAEFSGYDHKDPGRLCILSDVFGVTGEALGAFLETRGVYTELHMPTFIVLVTTVATGAADWDALKAALEEALEAGSKIMPQQGRDPQPGVTRSITDMAAQLVDQVADVAELPATQAGESARWLEGEACIGLCLTETVVVYPPGVPLALRGETVTEQLITQIQSYRMQGHTLLGIQVTPTGFRLSVQ